jgi:hypothetical protein
MTIAEDLYDGWPRLAEELVDRLTTPAKHPTYFFFFLGSVCLYAGAGVWLEVIKLIFGLNHPAEAELAIRGAIATYFPAILGTAAMQLAISENLRSLRALGYVLSTIFVFLALSIVFDGNMSSAIAILLGALCSLFALLCWWIVNARDRSLKDDPPPEVATGGDNPEAPLLGDAALSGFEV